MNVLDDTALSQQAADWYLRMVRETKHTHSERRRFLRWLKAARRNVEELLHICCVDGIFSRTNLRAHLPAVALTALLSTPLASTASSDHSFNDGGPPLHSPAASSLVLDSGIVALERTDQGPIICADQVQFARIAYALQRDPDIAHQIHWRTWEELVAAAYDLDGFEVVLTPRSNDGGRDVIATRPGSVPVRVFDQVKAFSPGRLVSAHDVFALVGVLSAEPNVSKAIITTTTDFAPGVYRDVRLQQYVPYRLDLRPRPSLLSWIGKLCKRR